MVTPADGEIVCSSCGCVGVSYDVPGFLGETHVGIDPHSFDNGLGSEPLQTIRDLRFNSKMLKNSWQSVLGYLMIGHRDSFVENCMRDLTVMLDGIPDDQFVQCRRLLLKEIARMKDRGSGPSRRRARQQAIQRTLEEAARTWPRIRFMLRSRAVF
jgi:hypothetical protein